MDEDAGCDWGTVTKDPSSRSFQDLDIGILQIEIQPTAGTERSRPIVMQLLLFSRQ